MNIEPEIAITLGGIIFQAGLFVSAFYALKKNIARLEEKQDKHNSLIERMAVVEQSTKSAHHRIDRIENK